jgi:hypothetical protein
MTKTKRYLKKTTTLKTATDTELFTEVMKRVVAKEPRVCYFVDHSTLLDVWNMHTADMKVLMRSSN